MHAQIHEQDIPRIRWGMAVVALATMLTGVVVSPSPAAQDAVVSFDRAFPAPGDFLETAAHHLGVTPLSDFAGRAR